MTHDEIQERLSEFRDGELSGAQAAEVSAHLADCPECRAELALYGRAAAAFLRPTRPPSRAETEAFARAVRARLEEPELPAFLAALLSSPRWAVPALAAAFAAALLAVVPARDRAYDPAAALLISEDGGQAYAWLSGSEAVSTAALLPMEER